ncbi:MAG: TonB family protein [Deltaproteobacteria bacterium]|nr:TonB family protein [Deltaproteobacteria bacterium]
MLAGVFLGTAPGHASPLRETAERQVFTEPGELPQLTLKEDGKSVALPLEHTSVRAEVAGFVADVTVTQRFGNPYERPIEAVYVFPLPENSAVHAMRMVIGQRVIEAEVREREDARRTYDAAKAAGHTAALLEQERPNVFTQSVANIAPRTNIEVVLHYLQTLTYDAGEYELVFPMVVGPRFMPGTPLDRPNAGAGGKRDTDLVPDASRISPPVLGQGLRSGHDIELEVSIDAGLPIASFDAPTHETDALQDNDSLTVRLQAQDNIPNRDFVLRWRVDGNEPQATVLTHKGKEGGFVTLIVQPPQLDLEEIVGDRELVFVIDVSGSMSGWPLFLCQQAMTTALGMLRPVDTFNVITFSGAPGQLFERPRPANDANTQAAKAFVNGLAAGGGTYMLDAISAALRPSVEHGRRRYVLFMTDGFVGNEAQIIEATRRYVGTMKANGQETRVFGLGIGSSPNRYLIDGLGQAGRGLALYASLREDPAAAVNRTFQIIDRSILRDVHVDWGQLGVTDVLPAQIPDLFASRPLVVLARYREAKSGTVTVSGVAGKKTVQLPIAVQLAEPGSGRQALVPIWARAKIASIEPDLVSGDAEKAKRAILDLGLEFHLVTAFTSLVAVDRQSKVAGNAMTVVQPVETPEGVDAVRAGATQAAVKQKLTRLFAGSGSTGIAGSILGGGGGGTLSGSISNVVGTSGAGSATAGVGSGYGIAGVGVTGSGRGYGQGYGISGDRNKEVGSVAFSAPVVMGALSREVIQKVILENRQQVRYCYELELQRQPTLEGKVVVKWVIAANGSVAKILVVESTLPNKNVEKCILAKIRAWKFAPPAGGGIVEVNYPFVFRAPH